MSQPILIPWEKFMREPVFRKKDILPVKEYDFEGRKYYSYNNIEKILKTWYGNNCLKKWNKNKKVWEETLPVVKRKSKHYKDVNLSSDNMVSASKKRLNIIVRIIFYLVLFLILGVFIGYIKASIITILLFIVSLFCIRVY